METVRVGRPMVLAVGLLILLGAWSPIRADYLPLAEGNTWVYRDAYDNEESRTVAGRIEIFGEEVFVIDYLVSPYNGNLENYWTSGPDGDVYLWGFFRDEDENWGYLYDPPVAMVDAPLSVGLVWSFTTTVYLLPGVIPVGALSGAFMVDAEDLLEVPAGVFPAFGIVSTEFASLTREGRRYTLWGEEISARDNPANRWWSLGVGVVQYPPSFQLESYIVNPVANEFTTWTAVKQLFR